MVLHHTLVKKYLLLDLLSSMSLQKGSSDLQTRKGERLGAK